MREVARDPQPCLTPSSHPGVGLHSPISLHCCVAVDGRCSRWQIPSTIPGASELFKTLLTQGDNPAKAVKHHVLRGWLRQQGCAQAQKGDVRFQLRKSEFYFWWSYVEVRESLILSRTHTFLFIYFLFEPPVLFSKSHCSFKTALLCTQASFRTILTFNIFILTTTTRTTHQQSPDSYSKVNASWLLHQMCHHPFSAKLIQLEELLHERK